MVLGDDAWGFLDALMLVFCIRNLCDKDMVK